MKRYIDFEAHNAEVEQVWDGYRRRRPVRVPLIFGINVRYTMQQSDANPRGVTFQQYFNDPQVMLERQLEHLEWVRLNVPQDAEMGLPPDGWAVRVDFQNTYEAAWFGCNLYYVDNQVPDTLPILSDDTKHSLFDRGIPDPFSDGIMQENWDFYAHMLQQKENGFTWKDLPLASVSPTGAGTDGPLTIACNLRGASEFFTDLIEDPEYAHRLLNFITDATIARIKACLRHLDLPLKSQGWGFADDSIQLISTEMYREFVLPCHKRLVDAFSAGGPNSIHLCGDSMRHFPLIKQELNVQSFDTGFPVDFAWLRRTLGPDVEILGGPSIPFLEQATPEATIEETRRILNSGIMEGGRFTLREGNNLSPSTPIDNLWAMYDTVRTYGCYAPDAYRAAA